MSANLFQLDTGVECAAPVEDDDLLAQVQDIGGLREIAFVRQPRTEGEDVGRVTGDVSLRPLAFDLPLLQVYREGDVRHAAPQQGRSAREVCDVLDMRRTHHADAVLGDVGEHFVELDVLLRAGADQIVVRHPRDRQHGLTIQLGVVQAVEQVQAAGA
jgi:hypothetical protein